MSYAHAEADLERPRVSNESVVPLLRKTDASLHAGFPFENVLSLQKTAGNQAVQRLLQSGMVQAKLLVSQPNDDYELEANRAADAATEGSRSSVFERNNLRGVNLQTDYQASMIARAFNARAVTVGNEVFFGQGQYAPQTLAGRKLIAHELAHTVQQRKGASTMVQRQAADEEKKNAPAATKHVDLRLYPDKYPKQETSEERISRILKEKSPELPRKKTVMQMTKNFVSETVGDVLGKLGVPHKWHDTVKDAAYNAVVSGAESLLDKAMDGAGLDAKGKKAVKKAVEAGAKTPLF